MKTASFLLLLFFATSICSAQQAGQLLIISYDDTGEIGYVCNGQPENSIPVRYGLVNLNQSVPLTIDSIVPQGDSTQFVDQTIIVIPDYVLGSVGVGGDAAFAPTHTGDDTIHETVYYNGQFTATASIVFHARTAPDLAMSAYVYTWAFIYDGNGFGAFNLEDMLDTVHDKMTASGNYIQYFVGAASSEDGGNAPGDEPVILRSCGGAIIDSIYEVGDFSEFSFNPFPQLPFSISGDDSLVINYEFAPKVIDTNGSHHHYLIFHSKDGTYLVWSFEYYVYPSASVSDATELSDQIKIFPNPATDALQILGGQVGTVRLFDIMGRERMTANDDGTGTTLDVSRLEAGAYFLRLGNQSAKVEVTH